LLSPQTRFAKFSFILKIAEYRKTPPLRWGYSGHRLHIRRRAFDRAAIVLKSCPIGSAHDAAASGLRVNDAAA